MMLITIAFVFFFNSENTLYAEQRDIQEEVIYQILVDRYQNGNHQIDDQVNVEDPYSYHGGDLEGIINRLNDLQKLGITTISLSPIMANAENGYHGYWVEDFFQVEEQFGTMEDFQTLIEEAHNRDMKVVIDFVTSYVAPTSSIAQDPEKADWTIEHQETDPQWAENTLKLDLENEEVQQFLLEVAEYWMTETNVDGYKLHAVDQIPISFLSTLTEKIKTENPNFYLIGEVIDTDENRNEIMEQTELDLIENVALNDAIRATFIEEDRAVEEIYQVWGDSENHLPLLKVDDMYSKRFTQAFAENGRNYVTVWKMALTYMYTTPGVPVIFQGSEIPMYGGDAVDAQRLVEIGGAERDLQEFFDRISALRSQFPALQKGDFELVGSSNAMSVFKRTYEDQTMYIAINNSTTSQDITVSDIAPDMELRGYLEDNLVRENENGDYRIGLPRESIEVYILQENKGINWGFIAFSGGVIVLFVFAVIYLSRKEKQSNPQ